MEAKTDPPVSLVYHAAPECPSEAEFVEAVGARGGRFDQAPGKNVLRTLEISIAKTEATFRGGMRIHRTDGTSGAREVHAGSCAEITAGLALVAAIALRGDPEPAPAAAAPPLPAAPAPPPDDPRLQALHMNGIDSVRVSAGTLGIGRAMSYSVAAGAVAGLIPSVVLPRYDLAVTRANFITPPDGGHYIVGGVIRARVSWLGSGRYHAADSTIDIAGFSFGIDLCHAPLYDRRAAVLLLCAEYGGGVLKMEHKDAAGVTLNTKMAGLGTLGLNAELQYNIGRYFHFELKGGADVSVSDLSAEDRNGNRIFRAQPLSGYLVAGVGFHF